MIPLIKLTIHQRRSAFTLVDYFLASVHVRSIRIVLYINGIANKKFENKQTNATKTHTPLTIWVSLNWLVFVSNAKHSRACSCTYFQRSTFEVCAFILARAFSFAFIQYSMSTCVTVLHDLMMTWSLFSNYFKMIFKLKSISPSNLPINNIMYSIPIQESQRKKIATTQTFSVLFHIHCSFCFCFERFIHPESLHYSPWHKIWLICFDVKIDFRRGTDFKQKKLLKMFECQDLNVCIFPWFKSKW